MMQLAGKVHADPFGTNCDALKTVIGGLDRRKGEAGKPTCGLSVKRETVDGQLLLIAGSALADQKRLRAGRYRHRYMRVTRQVTHMYPRFPDWRDDGQ